jgi:hypothetical protein
MIFFLKSIIFKINITFKNIKKISKKTLKVKKTQSIYKSQ